MELLFLAVLLLTMAAALGSGFPVAFALPGAAILTIGLAAGTGYLFAGSTDAYFLSGGPGQWLSAGVTNLRGVYWEVERDTLIAIPLFIFMGIMLQRSKIAEDLLVTMAQLFGAIPGGLGISVVFVGALLAATTGIVGATVVAMGLISLPTMLRNNYSPSLATGTIAASGTLGQIIPPSIVLIILADQLASATDQASTLRKTLHKEATGELSMPTVFDVGSTSAGEMFLGAFVPGLVLVGLYMLFILGFSLLRPGAAPPVPYGGEYNRRFWGKVALTLIPPLALIFLVLGSIIAGIATVNQAGAIGAAGALIMAGYRLNEGGRGAFYPALLAIVALGGIGFALANYEMNVKAVTTPEDATGIRIGTASAILLTVALIWSGLRVLRIGDTLRGVMIETAKTTSLVFIILLGAAMLTAAFRAFGGEELVREFLNALPGGFWSKFVIVMAVIFVLGFFLDFIEIAVVVVPIVAPILLADPSANITAVWLGVMIGLNIQTSFLTPPFGFALFYLRGVAPAVVKTVQMYKGVIAFIGLQLTALVIVGLYPPLVNYLPNRVSLLSETAPPPRNPRLRYCVEEFVFEAIQSRGEALRAAIDGARGLDLGVLPDDLAGALDESFAKAEEALTLLPRAKAAEAEVKAASADFRPILDRVRDLQADMRAIDAEIAKLKTEAGRLRGEESAARKAEIAGLVAELEEERAVFEGDMPPDWEAVHADFTALRKAESDLRDKFRRAADDAYTAVLETRALLASTADFAALKDDLRAIRGQVAAAEPAGIHETVNELAKRVGKVEGTSKIKSALSKARRGLRAKAPDKEKALAEIDTALALYDEQAAWRAAAQAALTDGLASYETAIRDTLGVRQQSRMTRDQSLYVAGCISNHRDLSLNF